MSRAQASCIASASKCRKLRVTRVLRHTGGHRAVPLQCLLLLFNLTVNIGLDFIRHTLL